MVFWVLLLFPPITEDKEKYCTLKCRIKGVVKKISDVDFPSAKIRFFFILAKLFPKQPVRKKYFLFLTNRMGVLIDETSTARFNTQHFIQSRVFALGKND